MKAVFGADISASGDVVETVTRFKVATVVTCVRTYVLGIFLIWLADRLDLPGLILGEITD
jgi:hypothetical protein